MAKPVSEEELQLKKRARRRLMGAIVLVAAVAVILPMVLDSEPKPTSREISIQIPSTDVKGFTSKVVPLTPPPKGDAKAPEKTAEKSAESGKDAAQEPTPKSAEKAAGKTTENISGKVPVPKPMAEKAAAKVPDTVPEKAAESAATPKSGTFFIQVTALADMDRAKQVQQRIIDAGFAAYLQTIPAGKGKITRVRAGPFASREEADKAQATLQGLGLEGKVAGNP